MIKKIVLISFSYLLINCHGSKVTSCYPVGNLQRGIKIYLNNPLEKRRKFEMYDVRLFEIVNDSLSKEVWYVSGNNEIENGIIEYGKGLVPQSKDSCCYIAPKKLKINTNYESVIKVKSNSFGSFINIIGCKFKIDENGDVVDMNNTKE